MSRPRNHCADAKGTPTASASWPVVPEPVCVEHQNVPAGVSVYWYDSEVRSCRVSARRTPQLRQTSWPSIAPVTSVGRGSPSFAYAR